MSINWEGTIFYSSKQLAANADDTDLIGRGPLAVKESFIEMEKESRFTSEWTRDEIYDCG